MFSAENLSPTECVFHLSTIGVQRVIESTEPTQNIDTDTRDKVRNPPDPTAPHSQVLGTSVAIYPTSEILFQTC